MDWPTGRDADLLAAIVKEAALMYVKKRKNKKALGIVQLAVDAQRAMYDSRSEAKDLVIVGLLLGMEIGEAGFKDWGFREYLCRSGAPRGRHLERNMKMASEFLEKSKTSRLSPTALKQKIGKSHGLESKSQSVAVIDAALKRLG